jgi:hypothetical protein
MECALEMVSGNYVHIEFLQIVTGVQAILGSCLSNLRGCNVGTIDGGNL